jgi:hypothetical protein
MITREEGSMLLGVRMHGATLNLEVDRPALLEYAAQHLAGLAGEPVRSPDLRVRCRWSEGDWDRESNPFPPNGPLDVIGKRMLGSPSELVWLDTLRMPGLQLRFRREDHGWLFDIAYRYSPKVRKSGPVPEYEYKRFFSLMSYIVYYPLMWYLERTRGWVTMHASALATRDGGIVIGGVGGVGKTTTCVALLARPDVSLVAENLVFTDGKLVYPCYEPIRLDDQSLALLGDDLKGLKPMTFPDGLKKKLLFHLGVPPSEKMAPSAMFLPEFSNRRHVTPLEADLASEKLLAMNRLTRELDDYGWYAAALDLHWPKAGHAAARCDVLRRFARETPCFSLGIDRSAGVAAVVDDILTRAH